MSSQASLRQNQTNLSQAGNVLHSNLPSTADDPIRPKIVLQVCDADTLKVLAPEGLQNIKGRLVKCLTGAKKDSVGDAEKVFGVLARP